VSSLAFTRPSPNLIRADLLKLRRRRGLTVLLAVLLVGCTAGAYGTAALLHLAHPATQQSGGGLTGLADGALLLSVLGGVAAAIVGATAATADHDAGVYRDLVVTGRSRLALYTARIPAGLLFLLVFLSCAYLVAAVASVAFNGGKPAPSASLLAATGAWLVLEVAFYYVLALALACLLGSRSYAITAVLAWRLVLSPLLAGVTALGVARDLIPGVALDRLAPHAIAATARQGPAIGVSLGASLAVVIAWTTLLLVAAGRRDSRRDA
jgi:ABC-type transport system involved in multi-copper enzyme maturation permease subunit